MRRSAGDRQYYEQPDLWGASGSTTDRRNQLRIRQTAEMLPMVSTLLDLGAGDGAFVNYLVDTGSAPRRIVALDFSIVALRHAQTRKVLASSDALPFADRSFDCIAACEVIEHLPFAIYEATIAELGRVANRYILITVPNMEVLESSRIECSYCGCTFHRNRHLRSFTPDRLETLLPGFYPEVIRQLGPVESVAPAWMMRLAHRVKLDPVPGSPICPQCGYGDFGRTYTAEVGSSTAAKRRPPYRQIASMLGSLVPRFRRQPWLAALYRRLDS